MPEGVGYQKKSKNGKHNSSDHIEVKQKEAVVVNYAPKKPFTKPKNVEPFPMI